MEKSWYGMLAMATIAMSLTFCPVCSSDPGPLQDFCVGVTDPHNAVFVNGFYCKDPKDVTVDDFLYKGYNKVGDTNNKLGSKVVQVNATTFPAINTLGVAMGRIDYAPYGLNPPHFHPRASEMLTVIEGTLYVGFMSSRLTMGGNKLYAKVLNKGDIYVFPQGLIHFQLNLGDSPAIANVAFGSQQPGITIVAEALFGTNLMDDVLTKGFQVDQKVIDALRTPYNLKKEPQNYGL